jgi:hypothetical protein
VIEVADFSGDACEEERAFDQRECDGGGAWNGIFRPVVVAEAACE